MIEIRKQLNAPKMESYPSLGDPEKALFFDIETTGLSPYGSALYLIGAASVKDGAVEFCQWFSESLSDEIPVLRAFAEYVKGFDTLVHFNGDTFDVPYLSALYAQYHLECPFGSLRSVDLLRAARKVRKILDLKSIRQKDLEKAFGLQREDVYSGGELIFVYQNWQKTHEENALRFLLLHNEEDVLGLFTVLRVLGVWEAVSGSIKPCGILTDASGDPDRLILQADYPFAFPMRTSLETPSGIRLEIRDKTVLLHVPVFQGTLRNYLPEPSKYYYLPKEDMIIPKELGSGVAPGNRVNAQRSTCYVKASGEFVPALKGLLLPVFRQDLGDRACFVRRKDVDGESYLAAFFANLLTGGASHDIDK